jgi:hypothetical protein
MYRLTAGHHWKLCGVLDQFLGMFFSLRWNLEG